MTIKIKVTGIKELRQAFTNMGNQFDEAVDEAVEDTLYAIEREIKTRIQRGPKSGRVYRRGGVTHQASSPGQPPATDIGALVDSVKVNLSDSSVGSNLAYAAYLEYGTRKMAPRPVWVPVAEQEGPKLPRRIEDKLRRFIR